jgi:hypothetical protein
MKKILLTLISFILLFSLVSCLRSDLFIVERDGFKYYLDYSDGIKSATNYHPYNFFSLPKYQELIQHGDGAGLENDGVVYFIYVVDTSISADDSKAYYCAEFDGETKEFLCESGEYFENEEEKNKVINRLLAIIEILYVA